ncbi:MAG: LLM class F420-dependent oxidoreductase [Pseudomonadales bacterium]
MKIGVSLPVREMQNDLGAIKAYAQLAEELGLNHLRVPEQIARPGNKHLHESMMLLAYIAGVTEKIELFPSVVILPARQTVLFAKQAAELDILTGGRVRIGVGVGGSPEEYAALGMDFHTRGRRCDEQLQLLKQLWSSEEVNFSGEFDQVEGVGLNPLPVQRPIPIWIGAASAPTSAVVRRIGQQADGWLVLCNPEEFPSVRDSISRQAESAGRNPDDIGMEAGVAVVGPREAEWKSRVENWHDAGLTHLCLRTLGAGLSSDEHLQKLQQAVEELPHGVQQ